MAVAFATAGPATKASSAGAGAVLLADPWELLGPVLPGDHAPVISRPSAGTYPAWSVSARYRVGDKVLYQGLPYEARWDNQGVSPQGQPGDPTASPWKALYKIPGEPAGTSLAPSPAPVP